MKLLVNLSTLGAQPTGLGVYAGHCASAATHAFSAELIAPPSYRGPGTVSVVSPPEIALGAGKRAALRRWAWARRQPNFAHHLLYSPTHHGLPQQSQQILTIHDLIALRYPRQHPAQFAFFRYVLPRQLPRCRAVFTVSETSRQDIHEAYRYPLESIHVVPNGVNTDVFHPPPDNRPRQKFLLMVGAGYPHKNVEEILRMAHLWKDHYRLIVVSCRGKYLSHLQGLVRDTGIESKVEFKAYVTADELVRLYQQCHAFIYPSKWEGFGIPPLEALACGAAVMASDIPAHREVLGSHVNFIRLGDEASWAAGFAACENWPADEARKLAAAAAVRHYNWKTSGERLVKTLKTLVPQLSLIEK